MSRSFLTNSAFVSEVAELGVASTARTTEVINRSAEILVSVSGSTKVWKTATYSILS